ncbi:sulfite exporter TauE/SafE family protein [Flindersiella endophytica]
MSYLEIAAVFLAGMAAGTINAVVGSGTLVTFPTLLAFGVPPITATVTNTVGLVPGNFSGAWGYRRELSGQRSRLIQLGIGSVLGAVVGVNLLLQLPEDAFHAIVPALVSLAVVLVILQPWIAKKVAHRRSNSAHGGWLVRFLVFLTGIYGGYFAAAQGVMLTAILGVGLDETLQRINAAKNVLVGMVNTVAAIGYIVLADVSWPHAGLIAIGSMIGGQIGSKVGRKLPPTVLRGVIVVVGVAALVQLLT